VRSCPLFLLPVLLMMTLLLTIMNGDDDHGDVAAAAIAPAPAAFGGFCVGSHFISRPALIVPLF